jgi:hypothetical protein
MCLGDIWVWQLHGQPNTEQGPNFQGRELLRKADVRVRRAVVGIYRVCRVCRVCRVSRVSIYRVSIVSTVQYLQCLRCLHIYTISGGGPAVKYELS